MAERLRFTDDDVMTLKDDVATVSALVRRVPRERLSAKRFGDWSAIELVSHVTNLAEITQRRVERCLAEEEPFLESVPSGTLDPERDPIALARRLQTAHAAIVDALLEPGAAERPARHPEWGQTDAGHVAAYHAHHAHEHLNEVSAAFPPS